MKKNTLPVIVNHTFEKSIETVWNAITQIDLMRKWYFENIPEFKPIVGFKTQFNVKSTSRDFIHYWEITKVIPFKKITYEWTYEGIEGVGIVTFDISTEHNSTVLILTSEGLDSFPDDIPEFNYESCLAGWDYFIKVQLAQFLNTN